MGFQRLLGNQRLLNNLRNSIDRGRISHFYLISGPEGSGKHTLAQSLAAAILCKGSDKPCGQCTPCRKVFGMGHPDFITVDDPEKKTVTINLVRNARADIYIQPNEADRKIYLFPRAQDMGIPGQNALLKVLEEPPAYGVFILLTDNPQKLLPTVRSRCTELAMEALGRDLLEEALANRFPNSDPEQRRAAAARSGGYLGQAISIMEEDAQLPPQFQDFLTAYANRDSYGLMQVLVPMEKWKREALIPTLQQWEQALSGALVYRCGAPSATPMAEALSAGRSAQELMNGVEQLKKVIEYAQGNVSPAAICGYLEWALR